MSNISTEQIFLAENKKKRKNCFNRGSVDVFVRELIDVGEQIDKIRIGHDNKGFRAGWHLEKVEIRKLTEGGGRSSAGSVTFLFTCGRWLCKNEDDGAIVRELVPSKVTEEAVDDGGKVSVCEHRVDALDIHTYTVHVFTGDIRRGGTDANVFITLFGANGDSGERQLSASETHRDKFERGQEDIFALEAADLGYIRRIMIRHDDSNPSSDWYLDRVEVINAKERDLRFIFICERWLAKKKGDGKIKRIIYEKSYEGDRTSVKSSLTSLYGSMNLNSSSTSLNSSSLMRKSSPTLMRQASVRSLTADKVFKDEVKGKMKSGSLSLNSNILKKIPYTVRVSTGEKSDHSTKANAFVVFIGTDAVSEKIPLDLIDKTCFEPGSIETFSVEADSGLGDIKKIEFGHDGYSPKDSWYVRNVEVDVPTMGRRYFFPCECWLGKDKEDGKTLRIFSVDEAKELTYKPKIPYQMTLYTGDVKNGGTDAEIKFTLFGDGGQSEELKLQKGEDMLERNSVDTVHLEIDDVGNPTKIRIGHNGKGSRPHWFLDKVTLLDMTKEHVTVFKCGHWFSKTQEDGKVIRELSAEIDGKTLLEETQYTVSVHTGDKRGCGTDANVFLMIFGEVGDSGELALKESSTYNDKFERGHTDVFTFNLLNLGKLTKIRIWHDNKYMRSGWFLSSVDIVDTKNNKTYNFPCERWLAKNEDDGSLMRELVCIDKKGLSKENDALTAYEITLVTSDKPKAGTTHNVMITFIDESGNRSEENSIQNSSTKKLLSRGQTATVNVVSKPLGPVKSVIIRLHKRKGEKKESDSLKWHLQDLVVKDIKTDESYHFHCDDWLHLSSTKQNWKELERSEVVKSKVASIRELMPIKYKINVYTADVSGAGTDANVCITLYGENGDSGKRELKKKFRDLFERGNMDDFTIEVLDLGQLTKLHIEHDNAGINAGWMLDRIEVENKKDGNVTLFPCQQWLDRKKGDKQITRDLYPES